TRPARSRCSCTDSGRGDQECAGRSPADILWGCCRPLVVLHVDQARLVIRFGSRFAWCRFARSPLVVQAFCNFLGIAVMIQQQQPMQYFMPSSFADSETNPLRRFMK